MTTSTAANTATIIFPISVNDYLDAYAITAADSWAADQVDFYENAGPPPTPEEFAMEACWVVLNSGFRNTIARKIWRTLKTAIPRGEAGLVFRNEKKVRAMNALWTNRVVLHRECLQKIEEGLDAFITWCRTLDGFGAIIPYHLAKNFGLATAKKDIWLERLAEHCGEPAQALCHRLSETTGHKVGTVDFVWWYVLARGHLVIGPNGRSWAFPPPGSGSADGCGLCGSAERTEAIPLERLKQLGMLPTDAQHLLGQGYYQLTCGQCKTKIDILAAGNEKGRCTPPTL